MIMICNMTTPPTLSSSTFLAHYQQCVQPWKQQWLSWQLPAALPAALRNELVSQFHLEAQSKRGNQQSLATAITIQQHLLNEKKEMTGKITSLTSEEKQVKMMLKYIDQLSKKNDLKKTEIW